MYVVFLCAEDVMWDFCKKWKIGDHGVVDDLKIVLLCGCEA